MIYSAGSTLAVAYIEVDILHFHVLLFGLSFSWPAFSRPAFLGPCIFMSCMLVRHFHVLHFQVLHFQRPSWPRYTPVCVFPRWWPSAIFDLLFSSFRPPTKSL